MLDEIKKVVKYDCMHNSGMMLSVTLREMIWLMEQAEYVKKLELDLKAANQTIQDLQYGERE